MRQGYEYTFKAFFNNSEKQIEAIFNTLGKEGWYLEHIDKHPYDFNTYKGSALFSRPLGSTLNCVITPATYELD
jgi:hypothetical protein